MNSIKLDNLDEMQRFLETQNLVSLNHKEIENLKRPELTPGVGDGQGGLACCSPWGRKESDMTEQLN